ncbi:hypothetical protein QZH41_009051, partial [Actinostola sp. cb2023]
MSIKTKMAEGLLEDCRQLLSRFESRQNVRFEVFSEVWREMNFSFIHCGKKDANGRIQIRMTLSTWKDLNDLHEEIQELKHHDADYILRSLKNAKAFLFCATPTQLAYGSKEAIVSHNREISAQISADADKVVDRVCGVLERLHGAHTKYQEAKESVVHLEDSDDYTRSLDIASSTFDIDLASGIEAFHKWKQAHCQK